MQDRPSDQQHLVYAMDGNYESLTTAQSDLEPLDLPLFERNSLFKSIGAARRHLDSIKPDLVITYNWGATEWALAARTKGIAYCMAQDGFGVEEFSSEIPRRRFLRRLAMHGAKAVIVPSMTLADKARKSWGIKPPRLRVIPNGIETARFTREPDVALYEEAGVTPGGKNVIIVAALRPEKNVGRLIEAFRTVVDTHEDAKLLVVGDGIGRPALQMLTDRIGLNGNVVFLGHQTHPEKLLTGSRIFALSSDTEQMPISVVEAMAAGLPVVSTAVGDVRRMIAEDNRALIKGMRAGDLAEAIIFLLDHPEEASRIGRINQEKAQIDYTRTRMIAGWNAVFSEL